QQRHPPDGRAALELLELAPGGLEQAARLAEVLPVLLRDDDQPRLEHHRDELHEEEKQAGRSQVQAPALEIAQAAMPTAPQASRVPSTVQAWFSGPPRSSLMLMFWSDMVLTPSS